MENTRQKMIKAISASTITKHAKFSNYSDREISKLYIEGKEAGLIK